MIRRLSSLVLAVLSMAVVTVVGSVADVGAAPGCGSGGLGAAELNQLFAKPGLGATAVSEGFGGGDYQHAYPLPDGRILWLLQDLHFSNDEQLGATNAVHNGAIVQDGNCWSIRGERGRDFIGDSQTQDSRRWFWPLDGEIGPDGNLWVYMAEMVNPNGNGAASGLRPVATWRAILDPVSLRQLAFDPAPGDASDRLYGQSIVSTDRHSFLYANCYKQFVGPPVGPSEFDACMRNTYVARVPLRQFDAPREYWNGSAWVADAAAAQPVLSRGQNANMMSVQWFGDTFVNVSKVDEWWGADITIDTAPTATGPWTTVDTINILATRKCDRCGIYGAELMPWLDTNGQMTIAVSNGTDFATWRQNAYLYRPSFYTRPVPASPAAGQPSAAAPPTFAVEGAKGGFVAVDPERLLDTREPGQAFARLTGGTEYRLDLSAEAPPEAIAVALNLTTMRSSSTGYLRAYACRRPEPDTSTLNPVAGEVVANAAIVPLEAGMVCFRSLHDTDLVVDLNGWIDPSSNVGLAPIIPRRVVDSRSALGAPTRLAAGSTIEVGVVDPTSNATAVSLSVTAVASPQAGFVTAWPCGTDRPTVANLNPIAGTTRPNFVNVRVGDGGMVCLYTDGETDLVVDVLGELRPGAAARYTPVGPVRLLDTRTAGHRFHASTLAELVPLGSVVGAQANLTAARPAGNGFLTGYACTDSPWPGTANVNYVGGGVSTSLALITPSRGYGCVFSSVPTDVIVDLFGVWSV